MSDLTVGVWLFGFACTDCVGIGRVRVDIRRSLSDVIDVECGWVEVSGRVSCVSILSASFTGFFFSVSGGDVSCFS